MPSFRLPTGPDFDGALDEYGRAAAGVSEQALAVGQRSGQSGPGQLVTPRPIVYRSRSGQIFKGHFAKLLQTSKNEFFYSTTQHVRIQKGTFTLLFCMLFLQSVVSKNGVRESRSGFCLILRGQIAYRPYSWKRAP